MSHNPIAVIRHDLFEVEIYNHKALARTLKLIHEQAPRIEFVDPLPPIKLIDQINQINPTATPFTNRAAEAVRAATLVDGVTATFEGGNEAQISLGSGATATLKDGKITGLTVTSPGVGFDPYPTPPIIPHGSGNTPGQAFEKMMQSRLTPLTNATANSDIPTNVDNYHWALAQINNRWLGLMPDYPNSPHVSAMAKIFVELIELRETIERSELYRMRMSAISTAALGYFKGCSDIYSTPALADTVKLYEEYVTACNLLRANGYSKDPDSNWVGSNKLADEPTSAVEAVGRAFQEIDHVELEASVARQDRRISELLADNRRLVRIIANRS